LIPFSTFPVLFFRTYIYGGTNHPLFCSRLSYFCSPCPVLGIRDRDTASGMHGGLRLAFSLPVPSAQPRRFKAALHILHLTLYTSTLLHTPRIQDGRCHIQPETIASPPQGLDIEQNNLNVCSHSGFGSGSGFGSVTSFALLHCSCFEFPRNLIDHDESTSLSLSLLTARRRRRRRRRSDLLVVQWMSSVHLFPRSLSESLTSPLAGLERDLELEA